MISLIKKKGGDIFISIPATILWPFVVFLWHARGFGRQVNIVLQEPSPISSRKEAHVLDLCPF